MSGAFPRGDRSYDIVVGHGVLADIGRALRAAAASRAIVIADAAVLDTHAARVVESLRNGGVASETLPVPSGEASKSLAAAGRLWDACTAWPSTGKPTWWRWAEA